MLSIQIWAICAEPQHGHEREVAVVAGLAGGGEQCLELQVGESEGR